MVTVYHILHFNKNVCGSTKDVGHYSSKEKANRAIAFLRMQKGFCDVPDGFVIQRCEVEHSGEALEAVYEAVAYYHTWDYEFEDDIPLGLFAHESEAQERIRQFAEDNPEEISGVERELIVNRCVLNRILWAEGYVTDACKDCPPRAGGPSDIPSWYGEG